MDLVAGVATLPDLLRLAAVPGFAWAAYRDVKTRRVPNRLWLPLAALGVLALLLETRALYGGPTFPGERQLFVRSVALSVGLLVPAGYLLWRVGGFGGADAKALMVIAVLYPTYPVLYGPGWTLPTVRSAAGLFSLTVLTNAVIVGAAYPLALGVRNALAGRFGSRAFVGRSIDAAAAVDHHGSLLEGGGSGLSRSGLDLDALRMYLRWRGLSLETLRERPELRDPATLPETFGDPTDGAIDAAPSGSGDPGAGDDAAVTATGADGGAAPDRRPAGDAAVGGAADGADAAAPTGVEDAWGARQFLEGLEHGAYGTTPGELQAGLDALVERDTVWISPGIPFLVPVFLGLVVGVTFGDVLVAVLAALGAG